MKPFTDEVREDLEFIIWDEISESAKFECEICIKKIEAYLQARDKDNED